MGREERELVRAGGRACGALGLDFSKLGELQRILELEWGGRGYSGDIFLVLHDPLETKGPGEAHLTWIFSQGALMLGAHQVQDAGLFSSYLL